MTDYCAPADLHAHGLPRGALPNPGRNVQGASGNALVLGAHGFDAGDQVSFRAEAGGSLWTPLAAATTYYAIPVNEDSFSVAASAGGTALTLGGSGTRVIAIAPSPVAAAISWASRIIDDMLPAHLVPLVAPIHELVRMTCAELAAGKLAARQGSASKSLGEIVDAARKRLERWAKGIPLRGENVPERANLAASASVPYRDSRGWGRFGGP